MPEFIWHEVVCPGWQTCAKNQGAGDEQPTRPGVAGKFAPIYWNTTYTGVGVALSTTDSPRVEMAAACLSLR